MDFQRHEGQSEWDMRQAFLQRLHIIVSKCHDFNFTNNYVGWYKALLALKIELSSHLRTAEEKENVSNVIEKLKAAAYSNNNLQKMENFIEAQETLHGIMRARGFDVPISERSPGHSTR